MITLRDLSHRTTCCGNSCRLGTVCAFFFFSFFLPHGSRGGSSYPGRLHGLFPTLVILFPWVECDRMKLTRPRLAQALRASMLLTRNPFFVPGYQPTKGTQGIHHHASLTRRSAGLDAHQRFWIVIIIRMASQRLLMRYHGLD